MNAYTETGLYTRFISLSFPAYVSLSHTHTQTITTFPSANCCDRVFAESRPTGRAGPPCGIRPPLPIKEKKYGTRIFKHVGDSYYFGIYSVYDVYILHRLMGGGRGGKFVKKKKV